MPRQPFVDRANRDPEGRCNRSDRLTGGMALDNQGSRIRRGSGFPVGAPC